MAKNKTIPIVATRFIGVILAALMSWSALAANFSILVKEKGNGNPVAGASVVLGNSTIYATTNQKGRANFVGVDRPAFVRVLAAGYETTQPALPAEQNALTVYMVPLTVRSETVEVVADRVVEQASKLALSRSELTSAAGNQGDSLKTIATLPGVVQAADTSGVVYMRGSGANDNVVWMNRAPVGYLYHLDGLQSTVPATLVEDINLFPAGFPVEYGDALGGAVDVRLRGPQRDRMHYQFDLSTYAAGFLIEGPIDHTDSDDGFYLAARRSHIDLLFSPAELTDLANEDDSANPDRIVQVPRFSDVQALYRRELSHGTLDTYVLTARDSLALELNESAKSDPQMQGELKSTQRYMTLGTTWQQRWRENLDHVVNIAYYQNEENTHLGRDASGEPFFAQTQIRQVHVQPEAHVRTSSIVDWYLGAALDYFNAPLDLYIARPPREDDIDYDFTSGNKLRIDKSLYAMSAAPYVKYRRQWTPSLTSIVGGRFTGVRVTGGFRGSEFSPRLTLEYTPAPRTLLTAVWGRYIQLPEGIEIVDQFGNPRLDFVESEHRVVGIRHRYNELYSLQVEAYHKPMRRLVIAIDERDPPNNYANLGEGEAWGVDLYLKREARAGRLGWLSLSYAKSRRTNTLTGVTRDFSGDQPLTLNAVWGQPFGENWKRWSWSARVQVHSGAPYTEVIGRHREDVNNPNSRWIAEYGEHNARRMPVYFKADLRIDRELLYNEWKVKLYLDLQNVTFQKNVVGYDYGPEFEDIGQPKETTGLPFFPFIGVAGEF